MFQSQEMRHPIPRSHDGKEFNDAKCFLSYFRKDGHWGTGVLVTI